MSARKILIAEDSHEVRKAMEDAFSEEGYEVKAAERGRDALRYFREFNPDLAVLDLRLPDMTGSELCSEIRQQSVIPVIIFSAVEDQGEMDAARTSGADNYIVKGRGLLDLLNRVSAFLSRGKAT